jgi:4-hydroxy-tetrahydrodipicolinate synthase
VTDGFPPRGVIGACLTPFAPGGGVDAGALESEIDFLCGHCDAVSILGAEVSEYRLLSPADRRRGLVAGVERVAGRAGIVAGASSDRLDEVIELAETAADAGAGFAQVLVPLRPWGPEPATAELVAFFEAVAARSPLPVVAYHNPTRGADPPPDALVRIAEIDGVAAFKESSRDMSRIGRLIEEIDVAGHARYFTTMQPLLATLVQGGSGAMMPAGASVIGAEVVDAVRAGDLERAAVAQRLFATFPARWKSYGLAPVMRSALRHMGVEIGDPPPPFAAVTPDDDAAIGAFLAAAGVAALASAPAPG